MTAVQTACADTTKASGCRFPTWCNGLCQEGNGEVNHWSPSRYVASAEYWDEGVSVELYGYEAPGDIHAVQICLAIGDECTSFASIAFTPDEARGLGNVLTGFRATDFRFGHGVLWHYDGGTIAVYIEFRQPRDRRGGKDGRQTVEVSIRDGVGQAVQRAQLELTDARKLGRFVLESADQADRSNAEFGLVTP